MVTVIPGSDLLTSALNVVSQSLQIPVIIFLLIFAVYSVITVGGLISEYSSRKKVPVKLIKDLIFSISRTKEISEIEGIIKNAQIPKNQKRVLVNIARSGELKKDSREALAEKLIENEEDIIEKNLQKTDIITKIGPTLGLMGTLIPMGPGLAALGAGDINTLASSLTVAFNTTIVGIGSGALCYVIGKIRSAWYDRYLSDLDALIDAVLDKMS